MSYLDLVFHREPRAIDTEDIAACKSGLPSAHGRTASQWPCALPYSLLQRATDKLSQVKQSAIIGRQRDITPYNVI